MRSTDDGALLRQYAENHSDEAFAGLVTRHINLVYSVALRQVGNPHGAEEITQAVFIILAKKAASLQHYKALSSWLFQATRLTASNFIRSESRRRQREEEAYMQSVLEEAGTEVWPRIAPLLDDAVAGLREKDRRAIVLRFYEGRNLREVGLALGASEDAAEKRVNRALEKLRKFFARRGVVSTAAIIAGAISGNSVQAAPAALANSAAAITIAKGTAASASTLTLIKGALKIMAWTKAKTAIVASACVLLAAGTTSITIYRAQKPMRDIQSEWSAISGDNGQWTFAGGKIEGHSVTGDSVFASSKKYGDVTFSCVTGTSNREATLAIRMQDATNGYTIVFAPGHTPGNGDAGFVRLNKVIAGNEIRLGTFQGPRMEATGKRGKIMVVAKGPLIEVYLNGANILRAHDATYASGYLGFRIYGWEDAPCDATFSSVSFY